ncbi:MAG TPA: type II secretion system protein GspJ [Thermodesulfobacteriota bacterium]|nr:type II secretion system protein GspJ [Thermodesulfobacteriota bacterium]
MRGPRCRRLPRAGPPRVGRRAGVTLVELLIATAILAVIMAIVASSLAATLRIRDAADRRTEVTHGARTVLDRIAQDLASAFVRPADGARPALPFLVEDGELDGQPRDRLTFATYGRPLGRTERASDQALVQYELAVSPDRRQRWLVRRQADQLDPERLAETPADVLAEGVLAFEVQVYDDRAGEWRREWRDAGRLPRAVAVTIQVAGPSAGRTEPGGRPDVRTYGTRLLLPLAAATGGGS